MRSTDTHPGAQWVYDQLKPLIPGLSLGTVYRNIGLFREEGSVVSLGVVDGEERFDAVTDPHPHLVCGRCGRVLDLPGADLPDILGGKFKILPEYFGFVIDLRKTIFYGFCKDCMANETCMTGRTCSADQAGPANRTCRAGKSSAANREGETTENGGPGPL
jgi:Fur family peroxide stress response transcriptional regulator